MDKQGRVLWNGKPYDKSKPYFHRPWEIEAYGKEEAILKYVRLGRGQKSTVENRSHKAYGQSR